MTIYLLFYQRPDDRWEWHALSGRTYLAVSPCSFASKAAAKRNAQRCAAAFRSAKVELVFGKPQRKEK